jgi:hypothetical protein
MKLMKRTILLGASGAFFSVIVPSFGAVIHNESINGDLSGILTSPTVLALTPGANTIIAQMGNNGNSGATNGSDADYFTVTIGPGTSLTSITLDSYTFSPGNPGVSFAAYVTSAAFSGQGSGNINGSAFINASSGNILDDFTGSATPLGQGVYSFWFQETSANTVNYQVTLNVIPEPSTTLLGLTGLGLLLASRRRKS